MTVTIDMNKDKVIIEHNNEVKEIEIKELWKLLKQLSK